MLHDALEGNDTNILYKRYAVDVRKSLAHFKPQIPDMIGSMSYKRYTRITKRVRFIVAKL